MEHACNTSRGFVRGMFRRLAAMVVYPKKLVFAEQVEGGSSLSTAISNASSGIFMAALVLAICRSERPAFFWDKLFPSPSERGRHPLKTVMTWDGERLELVSKTE